MKVGRPGRGLGRVLRRAVLRRGAASPCAGARGSSRGAPARTLVKVTPARLGSSSHVRLRRYSAAELSAATTSMTPLRFPSSRHSRANSMKSRADRARSRGVGCLTTCVQTQREMRLKWSMSIDTLGASRCFVAGFANCRPCSSEGCTAFSRHASCRVSCSASSRTYERSEDEVAPTSRRQ